MGGVRTAKSSIQNCMGKRFAVWPEDPGRSPKAGEGRVSLADIVPLFLNKRKASRLSEGSAFASNVTRYEAG